MFARVPHLALPTLEPVPEEARSAFMPEQQRRKFEKLIAERRVALRERYGQPGDDRHKLRFKSANRILDDMRKEYNFLEAELHQLCGSVTDVFRGKDTPKLREQFGTKENTKKIYDRIVNASTKQKQMITYLSKPLPQVRGSRRRRN